MELHRTDEGFALYKEKNTDRLLRAHARRKGGCHHRVWHRTAVAAQRLRLLSIKRNFARLRRIRPRKRLPYLPPRCPPMPQSLRSGQSSAFAAEGRQLVRRRTPDLTAVKFVQDFLAARLAQPRLCIDATCGNGGGHGLSVRHHRAGRKGNRL